MKGRRWHGRHLRGVTRLAIAWVVAVTVPGYGQEDPGAEVVEKDKTPHAESTRSVFEEFAAGNEFLLADRPAEALEAYTRAKTLEPDVPEIDFVTGLAHYQAGDYELARESFGRVAASADDELAIDAAYEIGASHHMQAVADQADPKQAVASLENAMRQYQQVLDMAPEHAATRDANRKAASMWRQLKQQMQQQQQQQQQSDNSNDNENQDQKDQDKQSEQDKQQDKDQQDRQQQDQQDQQQQDKQQQQDQQQSAEQEEQQQDQQQQDQQQQEQHQQEQTGAQEEQQRVSREQAQRRLREMMQALRDRQKRREKPVQVVPISPVEKDW